MTSALVDAIAVILFIGITLYTVLGGADFGAGVWDLLAGGPEKGGAPRRVIEQAVTPVWEANHVWLIFDLVLLWTAFSRTFSAVMTTLFVPLVLALFGIVVRGAGFAYRKAIHAPRVRQVIGAAFAFSSLATPFFFGTVIGAIATGEVPPDGNGKLVASWTGTESLLLGTLFVAACAFLSAVYLCSEAVHQGHPELRPYFVRRSLSAGAVGGVLALASFIEMHFAEAWLFDRLVGRALPFVIVSGFCVLAAQALLWRGRVRFTRPLAAAGIALMLWGWGVAQYPEMLVRSLSLQQAAAPAGTLTGLVSVFALVVLLVLPSFAWLFQLAKRQSLAGDVRDVETADLGPDLVDDDAVKAPPSGPLRLALAFLIGVAAGASIRCQQSLRAAKHRGDMRQRR